MIPDLLLEVPIQIQLRNHGTAPEAVVAVGGVEEAPVTLLVLIEVGNGASAFLAHPRQPRQRLDVLIRYELSQLLRSYGFGGFCRGPPVHAAYAPQHALHALRADAAPQVVDLAHRREGV